MIAIMLLLCIVTVTIVSIFATLFLFKRDLLESQQKVLSELSEIKNSLSKGG
jgi:hypothetical protein